MSPLVVIGPTMSGQIAHTDTAKLAYVHETYPGCMSTHKLNYLGASGCLLSTWFANWQLTVAKVSMSKVDFDIMVFVDR